MKKLCLLLVFLLLLSGCAAPATKPPQPEVTPLSPTETSWTEPELVTFDVYAINDLHGKFLDTQGQPGVDELSTYLQQAKERSNTILLSTGDMWQGSSESNLTGGFLITEWMNEMGFDAMTLGGHEFDWGQEQLRKNQELAQFPFLAINIYDRSTDQQVGYCRSSLVVEFEGVQIGIIGAIGDSYGSISSEHTKDVYFKIGDELTQLVKAESEALRRQGVDFIIYTIHDGHNETYAGTGSMAVSSEELSKYYDGVLSQGYVDLVFEADTHFSYVLTDSQGVYHLQAGGNNQAISHARVLIDKNSGDHNVFLAELIPSHQYGYQEDHPIVEQLLSKYAQQLESTAGTLGTNRQYRSNDELSQLVATLYRDLGVEVWGQEYDIVLAGGYISCRSPGYLPEGEVTYSQLYALLPFDNQITLCSIPGKELLNSFLETDHPAYHIRTTAYGDSIRNAINPDGTYYVVTDSYSAYYSYNNMTVIDTYSDTVFARDLVADHVRSGGLS